MIIVLIWLLWLFLLPPPNGVSGLTSSIPRLAGRWPTLTTTRRMVEIRPPVYAGVDRSSLYMAARPPPPSFPFPSKLKVSIILTKLVSHGRATASRLSHLFQQLSKPKQQVFMVTAAATVLLLLRGVIPRLLLLNRRHRRRRVVESDRGIVGRRRMDEAGLRLRAGNCESKQHPEVIARQQRPFYLYNPFRKRKDWSSQRRGDGYLERLQDSKNRLHSFASAVRTSTKESFSTTTAITTTTTEEESELDLNVLVRDIEALLSVISSVNTEVVPTTSIAPAPAPAFKRRRRFNFFNPFRSKHNRSGCAEGYLEQLQRGSVEGLRSFADTKRTPAYEETPFNLSVLERDMENLLREASLSIEKRQQTPVSTTPIKEKDPPPSNFYNAFRSSHSQPGRASLDTGYLGQLQGSMNRLSSFANALRSTQPKDEALLDLNVLVHDVSTMLASAAPKKKIRETTTTTTTTTPTPTTTDSQEMHAEGKPAPPPPPPPPNHYNPFKSDFETSPSTMNEEYLQRLGNTVNELSSFAEAVHASKAIVDDKVEPVLQLQTLVSDVETLLKAAVPIVEEASASSDTALWDKPASYAPTLADVKFKSARSGSQYLENLEKTVGRLSSFTTATRSTVPSKNAKEEDSLDLSVLVKDLETLWEQAAATAQQKIVDSRTSDQDPETLQERTGVPAPSNFYNPFKNLGLKPRSAQSGAQNNDYLERLKSSVSSQSSFVDAVGASTADPSTGLGGEPVLQLERLVSDIETLLCAAVVAANETTTSTVDTVRASNAPESSEPGLDLVTLMKDLEYLVANTAASNGEAIKGPISSTVGERRSSEKSKDLPINLEPSNFYNPFNKTGVKPQSSGTGTNGSVHLEQLKSVDAVGSSNGRTTDGEKSDEAILQLDTLVSDSKTLSTAAATTPPVDDALTVTESATQEKRASHAPTKADVKYQSTRSSAGPQYLENLTGSARRLSSFADAARCTLLSESYELQERNAATTVPSGFHNPFKTSCAKPSAQSGVQSSRYLERLNSSIITLSSIDAVGATADGPSSELDEPVLQLERLVSDIETLLHAAATTSETVQQALTDNTMLDKPASSAPKTFAPRRQDASTQNKVCELLCRLVTFLAFVIQLVVNVVTWLVNYAVNRHKSVRRWIPSEAAQAARSTKSANKNVLDISVPMHDLENFSINSSATASASSSSSDRTEPALDLMLSDIEMLLNAAVSPESVDATPRNRPPSYEPTLPGGKNQSASSGSLYLEWLERSISRLKSSTEGARSIYLDG